jgi:hypothetical protein
LKGWPKTNRGGQGMELFEIDDEELSVEEIMAQIRDNIRERKRFQDLDLLNQSWHTLKRKPLPSEKRLLGSLITIFKRLIWKLTRPYNTMILHQQIDFNANTVRLLNELHNDFARKYKLLSDDLNLYKKFQLKISQNHESLQSQLYQRYKELQQENILEKQRLDTILSELREKYNLGA